MSDLLLGVDAGLSTIKAAVFDRDGFELAQSTRRCGMSVPAPHWVERDMGSLWSACVETVRECVAGSARMGRIAGLGVTAHGDGLYPVDAQLLPVRPAILSLDTRAKEIVAEWRAEGKLASALATTGEEPWSGSPLILTEWLFRHERKNFERSRWLLCCKDFVRLMVTGAVATDPSDASPWTELYQPGYSEGVLSLLRTGEEAIRAKLPPVLPGSSVVGGVTSAVAAATGLPPGTPVVCGSHDVDACAIGMGAALDGRVSLLAGTFSITQVITSSPRPGPLWRSRHFVLPGRWLNMVGSPGAMANLDWFLRTFWCSPISHDEMEHELRENGRERRGPYFHPYLYSDGVRPDASGAIVGLRGWHTRADVIRAVMDGVVCCHRAQIDALAQGFQLKPTASLSGGAARSTFWSQRFADGLGTEIETTDTDQPGARGAAILAGLALGFWPDLGAAMQASTRVSRCFVPDPAGVAEFNDIYEVFRELDIALAPLWARL